MMNATITGIEASIPDYILTNAELERLVDTSDEWIRERTGIVERHILKQDGLGVSEMGADAVRKLLAATGNKPADIDMLVCHTVTPDMAFPSTANIISDKVGFPTTTWGYDIGSGCAGFLFSMATVDALLKTGRPKKIVLVCAERLTGITDYTDRNTCPLFGDGAVAMLIEPREGEGMIDYDYHVDGIGRHYLYQKAGGSVYPATAETVARREHFIYQDGKTVFKYAVSSMADVSAAMMEKHSLTPDDIAYLVPHQANLRIIAATGHRMGLDDSKVLVNIERFGNTGAVSIPLALWDFRDRLKKGDNLIFAAFGSGFAWGAMYYKWS